MPAPLANRPELPDHLAEVWKDFLRLGRSRPVAGMSGAPMPIPFETLDRYWARFGVGGTRSFEVWMGLIQAADDAHLQVLSERRGSS